MNRIREHYSMFQYNFLILISVMLLFNVDGDKKKSNVIMILSGPMS